MIPSLRYESYEERLARVQLFSLEKLRLLGKLMEYLKILKRFTNVDPNKLFLNVDPPRTKSNKVKLSCRQIQLGCTKFIFTNDVVRDWSKFPPSVVQYITINSFKKHT